MVHDSLSSSLRRPQLTVLVSPSFKQQASNVCELGSWSTLLQRHKFLLTTLVLLAFLCTVYLYFAITLGAADPCSGMSGAKKALCQSKDLHARKLRLF
ncbi:hypothetical protein Cni_G27843 [Canna indica]|uniref:Uncharacterized protein n=1 Tax=Canna indica TaxID=4628 RepID=A0AAQ3L254_9LILI|nr:hypothetical protein Cni_G27843 [Canna indica]